MATISSSANVTATNLDRDPLYSLIFATVGFVLGTVITVANSLIVLAVIRYPFLRTRPNTYIVSLACTDILVGLYQYMLASTYVPSSASYFDTHRIACVGIYSWAYCTVVCSGFNMCLIAFDRYLYIAKPLHYDRLITVRRVKVAIIVTWLAAILYGTSLLYVNTFKQENGCRLFAVVPRVYRSYTTSSVFVFCCLVTGVVYASIAKLTYHHLKRIAQTQRPFSTLTSTLPVTSTNTHHPPLLTEQPASVHLPPAVSSARSGTKASSLRALKMFVVVFGILVTCWSPYIVLDVVTWFSDVNTTLYFSSLFLGFFNSGMNFFVYPIFNPHFRTALKCMLTCRDPKKSSTIVPSESVSRTLHKVVVSE